MTAARGPLIIGHRGAPGYRPEHTRSSYEIAFALGADAVEPDIVATKDGVLVLRHENEISGTTDVASRPEFADRRTTKNVDGVELEGWFTEDFTWSELQTLRARERIAGVRPSSASFDGTSGILRLSELFEIVDRSSEETGADLGVVVEIKHATYFAGIGLPLDELLAQELNAAGWARGRNLVVESFEQSVLPLVRARGVGARYVYLIENEGKPFDLVERLGQAAPTYADAVNDVGLDALVGEVDGISVDKSLVLALDPDGNALGASDLVARAHERSLSVFAWTLRPENRFLSTNFRRGPQDAFGDWQSEFGLILGTGIDGVFLDHPDLGVAARDALVA